jgi:tRNA(Ile)-lysidine synthase
MPSNTLQLQSLTPQALFACLEPYRQARRWLVAFSGGVDSHVLLHLMAGVQQLSNSVPDLEAIHINHQLQPQAQQWAQHCEQQAKSLGIPFSTYRVEVDCHNRESLEEKARHARYRCLESVTQVGDVILMAHHLDDQVETVFMRLLRGSGSRGMAAMPHTRPLGRAQLYRPLLDTPRSDIESYAQQHGLQWVEDPSNRSCDFDRNYLRLQLLPQLAQRWPQYRQTLARAASLSEESDILNKELAELDFHSLALSAVSDSLPLSVLEQLSTARKKNLLRYWLLNRGLTLPTAAQLQAVLEQVVDAKRDAEPVVKWPMRDGGQTGERAVVEIRRFRDELYAMIGLPEFNSHAVYHWDPAHSLSLAGAGELMGSAKIGTGFSLGGQGFVQPLTVRFRQGGERCRPAGRAKSQTLKKLFQEYDVPTWLRDRIPLIYRGDDLAAVGDLWVCDGFTAAADQAGLVLAWRRP